MRNRTSARRFDGSSRSCVARASRPGAAFVAVAASLALASTDASAFCRTVSCSLPASWDPVVDGCEPTSFGQGCPTSMPPGLPIVYLWWRNACVSYDVQKDASRQASYDTVVKELDDAFGQWTGSVCQDGSGLGPSISVKNLGPVSCNMVQYNSDQGNQHVILFHDDVWPYDAAGSSVTSANTLGLTTVTYNIHTGEILDADTEINGTVPLSTGDPSSAADSSTTSEDTFDLPSILTHEMGHFLGLAHSDQIRATMYARYTPGSTTMRNVTADDVSAICSAYQTDGTRAIQVVTDTGTVVMSSITAAACDDTPVNGFQSSCAQEPLQHGCSVAEAGASRAVPWTAGLLVGGVGLGFVRRRRRRAARRTGA